jgi:hypothetical protein
MSCGIPPLKPRPGYTAATHQPATESTGTVPPISGMGDTWRLAGGRAEASIRGYRPGARGEERHASTAEA